MTERYRKSGTKIRMSTKRSTPAEAQHLAIEMIRQVGSGHERDVDRAAEQVAALETRQNELRAVLDETRAAAERHAAAESEFAATSEMLERTRGKLRRARDMKSRAAARGRRAMATLGIRPAPHG